MSARLDQDKRLRLRAALRRSVDSIYLLVIGGKGRYRLAAVQVHFKDGSRRDYEIVHRYGFGNKEAKIPSAWWAWVSVLFDSICERLSIQSVVELAPLR